MSYAQEWMWRHIRLHEGIEASTEFLLFLAALGVLEYAADHDDCPF